MSFIKKEDFAKTNQAVTYK